MEVRLPEGKTKEDLQGALATLVLPGDKELGNVTLSVTQKDHIFVRMRDLSNEEHLTLGEHLRNTIGRVEEFQFTTIGPTVGETLKYRAMWALLIAWIAIILYIALAFRKVPKGLSPWTFGLAAVLALVHDILLIMGLFVILAQMTNFEMDMLFVSALLSIMGYSVNDTIVIFDRIRGNLQEHGRRENLETIVERSIRETLSRTLNTGIGALIMLFALFFFGAESIRWFILTLIVGTVVGTYSSFFVATPLLMLWQKKDR